MRYSIHIVYRFFCSATIASHCVSCVAFRFDISFYAFCSLSAAFSLKEIWFFAAHQVNKYCNSWEWIKCTKQKTCRMVCRYCLQNGRQRVFFSRFLYVHWCGVRFYLPNGLTHSSSLKFNRRIDLTGTLSISVVIQRCQYYKKPWSSNNNSAASVSINFFNHLLTLSKITKRWGSRAEMRFTFNCQNAPES